MNPIILKEQTYEAVFSAENGALLSFKSYGREMLMQNTSCAVLEVRLLTAERKFRFFTDKDAKAQVRARKEQLEIDFSDFPDYIVEISLFGFNFCGKLCDFDCIVGFFCCGFCKIVYFIEKCHKKIPPCLLFTYSFYYILIGKSPKIAFIF